MMSVGDGTAGDERQRILVVEDSKAQRLNLRDGLGNDYELLWAANARDAVALAFTRRPHLILLDANIEPPAADTDDEAYLKPGKYVSGLELCRQLKQSVLKDTPVLVLTARSGFISRLKWRLAHANEYLTKPVEMDALRQYLYKYLGSPKVRSRLTMLDRLTDELDDEPAAGNRSTSAGG